MNLTNAKSLSAILLGIILAAFFTSFDVFAQKANSNVEFSPKQAEIKSGEERFVKVSLRARGPISGFDLYLTTSGDLEIKDIYDQLVYAGKALNSESKKVVEDIN